MLSTYIASGVWTWYAMRMNMLALMIIGTSAVFCIVFRTQTDPVMLGLMLQYTLSLAGVCVGTLGCLAQVEIQMVSVQRLF